MMLRIVGQRVRVFRPSAFARRSVAAADLRVRRRPVAAATAARGGTAHMTRETGMSRELKTEQELLALVVKALDANPSTAGWIPTGFHETVDDESGCNWDISHLHRDRKDADVAEIANSAAAGIINELRGRYNLR
ncbi:hypothetical protein P0D69_06660 [Paraburkholderia sediminicola]|uniref:hypothetical protein n=1 Tax=Paraburkholderia sediminicola TaxID=458836 RepID=UPI0038B7D9DB